MRPYAATAWALAGLAIVACGGDDDNGNGGPQNQSPTASFAAPNCTELTCTFTDASSDPDGEIASWAWEFQSGTPASSTEENPVVTFPAAGTYTVRLVVTDNEGATDDFSQNVTVTTTAPPENQAPTAAFDVQCAALECTFTSTSSDPDGTIASYEWDFGDPTSSANTSTEQNPTHTYSSATTVTEYTVTLTVTDDDGAQTTATEAITVTPPAGLQCTSGSELVNCTLDLTSKSIVTITLTSRDCEFTGNRFRIIAPVQQTVFSNGCTQPIGQVYEIVGPNPDGSFDAGSQIQAEFTQGAGSPEDPPRGPPAIRVEGDFPTWTISIDDGGGVGVPGEPDYNDIVLTAEATVVP